MSKTKRNLLIGALVLVTLLFPVLAFCHYTNFGRPYTVEISDTKASRAIWFLRGAKLFHVTDEIDLVNKWEAAEIFVLFDKKTVVYCRDGQVRAIVENGELIFLDDPEAPPSEGDMHPKVGKLMMDSAKRLLGIEVNPPEPKEQGKPSHSI